MHVARPILGLLVALAICGCAGHGNADWGPRWPTAGDLGDAAVTAARSPATWVPLAGAAVLAIGDLDQDLSSWAADEQPLFGDHAKARSDDLRSAAYAAWLITALAAPSDNLADKAGGLLLDGSALLLERTVTDGLKDWVGRERPDGSNRRSFPSGHASSASAATTLARHNLDYLDLVPWLDTSLRAGLFGIAGATGWARVEAEKHYVSDVLVGNALGQFVATFMHEAFMTPAGPALDVSYQPVGRGGALTVTLALP